MVGFDLLTTFGEAQIFPEQILVVGRGGVLKIFGKIFPKQGNPARNGDREGRAGSRGEEKDFGGNPRVFGELEPPILPTRS